MKSKKVKKPLRKLDAPNEFDDESEMQDNEN